MSTEKENDVADVGAPSTEQPMSKKQLKRLAQKEKKKIALKKKKELKQKKKQAVAEGKEDDVHEMSDMEDSPRNAKTSSKKRKLDDENANNSSGDKKFRKVLPVLVCGIGKQESVKKNKTISNRTTDLWIEDAAMTEAERQAAGYGSKKRFGFRKPPLPSREILRQKRYWKLRSTFNDIVEKESGEKPQISVFERWQCRSKCVEDASSQSVDPLFPARKEDVLVVSELQRSGLSEGHSKSIAKQLFSLSKKGVEIIAKEKAKKKVQIVAHSHTLDLFMEGANKTLMKINHTHYKKMKALFCLANNIQFNDVEEDDDDYLKEPKAGFHDALFCCLVRYQALSGHGFQCAVPEAVSELLFDKLGCNFECFASPLNCHVPQFCSAFPDIDEWFGSSGSFFKWMPSEGSFELNPPWEPFVINMMVERIEKMFNAAGTTKPLSFAIVIPSWVDMEAWPKLLNHSNLKGRIDIAPEDHGYLDGAAHQRKDRFRKQLYPSSFFVLQNEKGAKKWPVTKQFLKDLRKAFASGVPTQEQAKRVQLRDLRAKFGKNYKLAEDEVESSDSEDEANREAEEKRIALKRKKRDNLLMGKSGKSNKNAKKNDDENDDGYDATAEKWNRHAKKAGIKTEDDDDDVDFGVKKKNGKAGNKGNNGKSGGKGNGGKSSGKGKGGKGGGKGKGGKGGKGDSDAKGKGKGKGKSGGKGKGKGKGAKMSRKERAQSFKKFN